MKNFILTALFALIATFTIQAQELKDSSGLTSKYIYEDVKQSFTKLVNSLEGPAKHVYEVYTKEYFYTGLGGFLFFLALIVSCVIILIVLVKIDKKRSLSSYQEGIQLMTTIALVISIIGLLMWFLAGGFTMMVNPEYHAINNLLSIIK